MNDEIHIEIPPIVRFKRTPANMTLIEKAAQSQRKKLEAMPEARREALISDLKSSRRLFRKFLGLLASADWTPADVGRHHANCEWWQEQ